MLNDDEPNSWYVDITMRDIITDKVIKICQLPTDGAFTVTDDDWDSALVK